MPGTLSQYAGSAVESAGGGGGSLPTGLATDANLSALKSEQHADLVNLLNKKATVSGYAITQTTVTVTTASQQLVAANADRRYLSWMVVGTADVTIVPGAGPAVAGLGQVYQAAGVAGKQGASQEFPTGAPTNAFQCIAPAVGSTVVVWEGV